MATMSYGVDLMDEAAHQWALTFGNLSNDGNCSGAFVLAFS